MCVDLKANVVVCCFLEIVASFYSKMKTVLGAKRLPEGARALGLIRSQCPFWSSWAEKGGESLLIREWES